MPWRSRAVLVDQRGSLLVAALMTTFVITLLGFALFDLGVLENRLTLGSVCDTRAFYTAQSGLRVAYLDLGTAGGSVDFGSSWETAPDPTKTPKPPPTLLAPAYDDAPFRDGSTKGGSYRVLHQRSRTSPGITLISTGRAPCPSGSSEAIVAADVTSGSGFMFIGLNEIQISGAGALLDSFDSSLGAYDQDLGGGVRNKCQRVGCGVQMYTNGVSLTNLKDGKIYADLIATAGTVRLKTGATLYGTVTYDTSDGSRPQCDGDCAAQVLGGPPNLVPKPSIDPVTADAVPLCTGDSAPAGERSPQGYSSASYVASRISAPGYTYNQSTGVFTPIDGKTPTPLTVTSGTFCFSSFWANGDMTVPSSASATGPVTIKVTTGQTKLSGQLINNTLSAQYLRILSSSTLGNDGVWVTSGAGSYAFVYAPGTQVQVKGGNAFFGAALGKWLDASGGSQLHYDKALLKVPGLPGVNLGGSPYALRDWRLCRRLPNGEPDCPNT